MRLLQLRSQGLSSGGGKMRDPGNEVETSIDFYQNFRVSSNGSGGKEGVGGRARPTENGQLCCLLHTVIMQFYIIFKLNYLEQASVGNC